MVKRRRPSGKLAASAGGEPPSARILKTLKEMAEGMGFEPTIEV
jgi:hypothetical protein